GGVGGWEVMVGGAGMQRRYSLAQLDRAVRLAVAERDGEERLEIESHADEFPQRQRPHAALAHVVVDDVFPRRLHPLHLERFDAHDRYFSKTDGSRLPPLTIASTGAE